MTTKHHRKWLNKAIELALKNPIKPRGRTSISRMAAIIVYKTWIIGEGLNQYKTHPIAYQFSKDHSKIFLHAELHALLDYWGRTAGQSTLEDCEIYIARVLRDGTPALAKPCNACLGALTYYGIKDIHWTT